MLLFKSILHVIYIHNYNIPLIHMSYVRLSKNDSREFAMWSAVRTRGEVTKAKTRTGPTSDEIAKQKGFTRTRPSIEIARQKGFTKRHCRKRQNERRKRNTYIE
jgi:hypothetical protein